MADTWTPTVGDVVVPWHGYDESTPGRELTIERLTKTQIVTSDGRRWNRATLLPVGAHGFRIPALYRVDDPRLRAAEQRSAAKNERARVARDLKDAASWWVSHPGDDQRVANLRAAIIAVAPHLGLTVTVDADRCPHTDAGRPCLLPADHTDRGEWHGGIGWSASLGQQVQRADTTREG